MKNQSALIFSRQSCLQAGEVQGVLPGTFCRNSRKTAERCGTPRTANPLILHRVEYSMNKVLSALLFFLCCRMAQAAEYTNSIGMEFVTIPAGSFYMGSCAISEKENRKRKFLGLPPKKEAVCPSGAKDVRNVYENENHDNEVPQHKVTITRSFQLGKYEVTLGQFKQFIADSGREDLLTREFMSSNLRGDDAAVCMVSWQDAQDFIRWLNEKEGGNHYRLPTEAEWEYAARAGSITLYSWGDDLSVADSYAWYDKNTSDIGRPYPRVAGEKKPNPWGLYDMHGNVWEWCQDWYSERYYSASPAADPAGPSSGKKRVYRGGGWYYYGWNMQSAVREYGSPDEHWVSVGFRLLRQLPPDSAPSHLTPSESL